MELLMALAVLAAILVLAFFRASIWSWLLAVVVLVPVAGIVYRISADAMQVIFGIVAAAVVVLGVPYRWCGGSDLRTLPNGSIPLFSIHFIYCKSR